MTTSASAGSSVTSLCITRTPGAFVTASVILSENAFRSTASAPPAGTRVCFALSTQIDEKVSISAFKSPAAEFKRSAFNEFEQTSSAKVSALWAGERFSGFISYKSTANPARLNCHAASHPARPAPMTAAFFFCALILLSSSRGIYVLPFSRSRKLRQGRPINRPCA